MAVFIQSAPLFVALLLVPSTGKMQGKFYSTKDGVRLKVETVVSNLEIPWSIVFDTNGDLYFTERPGRLQLLKKGTDRPILIAELEEVKHRGEGGLMGLALHPEFSVNRRLYLSYTYSKGFGVANKVVRYTLQNGKLTEKKEIITSLPGSSVHNGCRIKFGPDRKLYITTGDAADRAIAQDLKSFGGKILRLNEDGTIPSDNPFQGSPVYAFGVRNPQGIDWHPTKNLLFETEHGPSGFDGPGGGDEVNIVEPGKNYGWPVIHHKASKQGMESPYLEYTPALAPASGCFYRGNAIPKLKNNFFFGCLRGQRIERVVLDEKNPRKEPVLEEALFQNEFGRIRDIVEGPDGFLYFATSNQDGRGKPATNDDRILRIVPVE